VLRVGIIDISGIVNIVNIIDVADIAIGITDIGMDIIDISTDICGYWYRYYGYCRLDIVNIVVETGKCV
jgi:hypothetical protein